MVKYKDVRERGREKKRCLTGLGNGNQWSEEKWRDVTSDKEQLGKRQKAEEKQQE